MARIGTATTLLPFARRHGLQKTLLALAANQHLPVLPGFAPTKVIAFVNHGRWVADCTNPQCVGAELVDYGDPVFFCLSCGNTHVESRFQRVAFPPPPAIQEIESLLEERPTLNQNWLPHEDMARLTAENAAFLRGNQTPPRHPASHGLGR